MKSLFAVVTCCFLAVMLWLSGCDIVNQGSDPPKRSVGNDLVINEVFTISPDRYYAFSWMELYNPTSHTIPLQSVTNPASGVGIGADGTIISTEDDGDNWAALTTTPPSTAKYNSASFPLPDTGYLAGDAGTLVKLRRDSTGAYTLTDLNPPSPAVNYNDVYAAPPPGRLVIAIGDAGRILQSVDRGATWTVVPSGTGNNLHALTYFGQNDIYAVGDAGTILKGKVARIWAAQSPPFVQAGVNYYSIGFFQLGGRGYVVGSNGAIAYTTNGGTIWKPVETTVTATLRSIFIPASGIPEFQGHYNRAWIVGDNGTILRTDDSTWTQQVSGTTAALYNVKFADSIRGWVVGEGGLVLKTTDGGNSWSPVRSNTTSLLTSVTFQTLQYDLFNFYALVLYAIKNHVFFDPATQRLNEDVIIRVDTGLVSLSTQPITVFVNGSFLTFNVFKSVPPGGFFVVNNDSAKFKDHTNVGPASVQLQNIGITTQSINIDSTSGRILAWDAYKWRLPVSGEMRLYKAFIKSTRGRNARFVEGSIKTIDVVRWGGFKAEHGEFNVPGLSDNENYDKNIPAGVISEFSSLARYYNEVNVDPGTESTFDSFYITDPSKGENPLPGYASQRGKK